MGNENRLAAIGRVIVNPIFMLGLNIVLAVLGGWAFAAKLDGDWRYGVAGAIFTFFVVNIPNIRHKFEDWRKAKHRRRRELVHREQPGVETR